MRNTLFDDYQGPRLPRQVQLERVKRVVAAELTPLQRETLLAYYFQGKNICQIAQERGVTRAPFAAPCTGRKTAFAAA